MSFRWMWSYISLTCCVFFREGGPTIFAQVKNGKGMDHIVDLILSAWRSSGAAAACEAAKKQ